MSRYLFVAVALGAVTLMLFPLGNVPAQTILIDDFNDGNDDGWTHYAPDFLAPGIFVVEDGAYHIRSAVKANEDSKNWLASLWDASEDPTFSNGFVTMKARVNADGVAVGAGMRTSVGTVSMYWFDGGGTTHRFDFYRESAGQWDPWPPVGMTGMTINPGEDWMMESGVVGDLLSMKVWRAGEPEPTRPQLTWMDREPLPPSPLGLMSVVDTRVPEPMYIDTTYDDIYFTFPVPGDFNSDRVVDVEDIDLLSYEIRRGRYRPQFDLNDDDKVDLTDHGIWVHELKKTWYGDGDLSGEFNSNDFVQVFQEGKYETALSADWAEGDWDASRTFESSDFVVAFQDGGYEQGLRTDVAAVPEPATGMLLVLGLGLLWFGRRTCAT